MDTLEAGRIARGLVAEWLGSPWFFEFGNMKRRAGDCFYARFRIRLSKPWTLLNTESHVRDVILHEIAHAYAGHAAGHGPAWRKVAREIGANPVRCTTTDMVKVAPVYVSVCSECKSVAGTYHRRPRALHRYRSRCHRSQLTLMPTINIANREDIAA